MCTRSCFDPSAAIVVTTAGGRLMIRSIRWTVMCVSMLVGAAELVQATTITFETHTPIPDDNNPQFQDGYRFDFNARGWIVTLFDELGAPYTTNGTVRLLASGDRSSSTAYVDMTHVSGTPFTLNRLDVATMFPDLGNGGLTITGQLTGGGDITQSVTLTPSYTTLVLPPTFTNLTTVRFQDTISGDYRTEPGFALDNIVIETIPEPSTPVLLLLATIAFAPLLRCNRNSLYAHWLPSENDRPRKDLLMKSTTALVLFTFILLCVPTAQADTFGSGLNTFEIEFVTIGNPDNPDDTTGSPNPAGKVEYAYRMGKYEISGDMIDKANAEGGLGIRRADRSPNQPATQVSWFEAAHFVNWLNTSTGSTPAYKFGDGGERDFQLWQPADAGYNPNNLYRNSQATYFLPSMDEWYKAAYYDPNTGGYYDYPTGSNSAPTPVASGTAAGTAVFSGQLEPADITRAGGLSPYGTMGQGGNVWEWEETDRDLVNDSTSSARGVRGGGWGSDSGSLLSSLRRDNTGRPSSSHSKRGFRVASTPEPSSYALTLLGMGWLGMKRGDRRQRKVVA